MHSPRPARAPMRRAQRPDRVRAHAQLPHARAAGACCLSPAPRARASACVPACAPQRLAPVLYRKCSGCISIQPCLCPLPSHNTIFVLRYSLSAAKPPAIQCLAYYCLQYNNCIATQNFPAQSSLLQYNATFAIQKIFVLTIQYLQPLQYSWAVA